MTDARLTEYAHLVVEIGLNVQKGQTLLVRAPVESADFARLCAEAAYDVGCREVHVEYMDEKVTRMRYLRADSEVFDECPDWFSGKLNTLAAEGAAFLSILAEDPDMLRGVDPDRLRRNQQSRGNALQPYYAASMSNKVRWCVASVPIIPWAVKVFPEGSRQDAVEALWEAIYKTLRITGDGKAVERWREHAARTAARCKQLNDLELVSLHYQNSLGTDLTVGLPEGAIWAGGSEDDAQGIPFIANMPTEEIFTAPHRDRVEGRVVSSMPFVLDGNLIDRFAFTFKAGKIVGIEAKDAEQKALLENSISIDEGAAYLGEAALVPFDSPISNLGILFYNTLYDENASCHLAFGKAYPCIKGGDAMSEEELKAHGINNSLTHQDFMIGTSDLSITGVMRDGRTVAIFRDGNFAL